MVREILRVMSPRMVAERAFDSSTKVLLTNENVRQKEKPEGNEPQAAGNTRTPDKVEDEEKVNVRSTNTADVFPCNHFSPLLTATSAAAMAVDLQAVLM
jgi:hypothetical protein